ncbi:MAG: ligase 1 [Chloroflexota bacterium]|nr:ligase 1 [Chloroflexota bacterium]
MAAYLPALSREELPVAVVFLTGRPFPERDARTTGIGWAAIATVAESVARAAPGALFAAYNQSSDLGTAVGDLLAGAGHDPEGPPPTLPEVSEAFAGIAAARGTAAKAAILHGLLDRSDALTGRYIAKILSGELRIGLREGHLEAAVAKAFGRDQAHVQWAGMLTGDIGRTAELARDDALEVAELALFRPLKSMLASPVPDEAAALARMPPPVWVEDKYDGIRAQMHKLGDEVRLYSRDLHDISGQFPEVVRAAAALPWDGILDGEVLGWRDGVALPFLQLQARLGRKDPSAAIQAEVPTIFVAFDLLAHGDGAGAPVEPLLRLPLRERRRRLDELGLATTLGFGVSNLIDAANEAELRAIFELSQQRGNEGLMVKDPDSPYTPGRRGYGWIKLKRPLTTLDCVVVGVEVGHGKRHGVLSDYTFAVLDDRPDAVEGAVVTIGKAYSGLTDAEIAEMTRWFETHTLRHLGRYRVVEPTVVVEIAFDVIHRSNRHASGYALRFPRIVRIRDDKTAAEVDRLSTVAMLHDQLQEGGRYSVATAAR